MSAYSASPSLKGSASKLPMQPRNLGARPGREERVFQVTNSGLADGSDQINKKAVEMSLTTCRLGTWVGWVC
jgi:hypothetical protein